LYLPDTIDLSIWEFCPPLAQSGPPNKEEILGKIFTKQEVAKILRSVFKLCSGIL